MTPIGSPRVPSTVGSSLATPVTRNDAGPDDSALAARLASPRLLCLPAMPLPPLHATPAECPAAARAAFALRCRDDRQRAPFAGSCLCCRSCFVSSSVLSCECCFCCLLLVDSHPLRPIPTNLGLCLFAGILRALGPSLGPGRVNRPNVAQHIAWIFRRSRIACSGPVRISMF